MGPQQEERGLNRAQTHDSRRATDVASGIWVTSGPHVGERVSRYFESAAYTGTVVGKLHGVPEEKCLYKVLHDDFDYEDLEWIELRAARKLFVSMGTAAAEQARAAAAAHRLTLTAAQQQAQDNA